MKKIQLFIEIKSKVHGAVHLMPVMTVSDELANKIKEMLEDEGAESSIDAVIGL